MPFMKMIQSLPGLIFALLTLTSTAREIPQVTPAEVGLSETKLAGVDQFMEKAVADSEDRRRHGHHFARRQDRLLPHLCLMDREAKKPMSPDTIFASIP